MQSHGWSGWVGVAQSPELSAVSAHGLRTRAPNRKKASKAMKAMTATKAMKAMKANRGIEATHSSNETGRRQGRRQGLRQEFLELHLLLSPRERSLLASTICRCWDCVKARFAQCEGERERECVCVCVLWIAAIIQPNSCWKLRLDDVR